MKTVTVAILTKNEESHIASCIANAKQCTDKILVIDSGSTDQTVSLAEAAGAVVQYRAWDDDFAAQRNFAHQFVDTDYILWLDADERMDEDLVKAVKGALSEEEEAVYAISRKSVIMGKVLTHGICRPDTVIRMYPVSQGQWEGKVHENVKTALSQKKLGGYIFHYTYNSWDAYLGKVNYYTSIWAENAYARGKRSSIAKAHVRASLGWFVMYVLHGGFLDGKMGFMTCSMHYIYTLMKYVKLDAMQRGNRYGSTNCKGE